MSRDLWVIVLSATVFMLGFALGWQQRTDIIVKDCQKVGQFRTLGKNYFCLEAK